MHGGGSRMLCRQSPNVSGRGPGGYWVSQLPFMQKSGQKASNVSYSTSGFSINGGSRTSTYIGKSSAFSQVSTPFKGVHARGHGGSQGQYRVAAVIQATGSDVASIQQDFIKPSVISTKCMLSKKLTWIFNSQYPNVWVQPTTNMTMGSYIEKLKSQNCTTIGSEIAICQQACANNNNLTKRPKTALSYSEYLQYLDKKCLNPTGKQKPFPFNINNNRVSLKSAEPQQIYYTAPEWYTREECLT